MFLVYCVCLTAIKLLDAIHGVVTHFHFDGIVRKVFFFLSD